MTIMTTQNFNPTKDQASGLLLLHKPAGLTSFDCVRWVKRELKRTDVGHGGTLDSFAQGLLPVLLGEGLKFSRFFLEEFPTLPFFWKRYEATMKLGFSTTTGDPLGEVLKASSSQKLLILCDAHALAPRRLEDEIKNLVQTTFMEVEYLQTPPVYSAKKVQGVRLSDMARQGDLAAQEHAKAKAQKVILKEFHLRELRISDEGIAEIDFEILCSKGFYVRSFATDLAQRMGLEAHLSKLVRTQVGNFHLKDAIKIPTEPFAEKTISDEAIISTQALIETCFPIVKLNEKLSHLIQRSSWAQGKIEISILTPQTAGVFALLSDQAVPLALVERTPDGGMKHLRGLSV